MKKISAAMKFIVILTLIALVLWFNQTYLQLTPSDIREWILAFGAFWGTVLTIIGATAGAALSFAAARFMGRNLVKMNWKGNMNSA
jgi:uncharacterized membrane protein YdjX (TVP38/TMEM64 family)